MILLSPIKIWGISEVADNLLVTPKELCSMELVSEFNKATYISDVASQGIVYKNRRRHCIVCDEYVSP